MRKDNADVTAYIEQQPDQLQPALRELRGMIRAAFPNASEEMYAPGPSAKMATDFPMYKLGDEIVASFAGRSVGARLYLDADVVARYAGELGSLMQGKVCVLYKPTRSLDAVALRSLFERMLSDAAAKDK
jgi:uncharacterized protein YdhG (YjbR/CyaY superfamily)